MVQSILVRPQSETIKTNTNFLWIGVFLTFLSSTLSFGYNYWIPEQMFWDENYHIASAYKYLNGVFFLENHPPLGKLIIAFFEKLWGGNTALDTSNFLKVDHINKIPKGFSFLALRLPSVVFGILSSLVFFNIIFLILRNGLLAWLCSLFFLLDNAVVLHSRSAMLEAPQLFFIFIACYLYFRSVLLYKSGWPSWILLGITFGIALAIKLNSAIVLLLVLYMGFEEFQRAGYYKSILKMLTALTLAITILITSYYAHFRIARTLEGYKDYDISEEYKEILKSSDTSFSAFLRSLKDHYLFIDRYNSKVPRLKEDSPKENGSHPIFWPMGKKSIAYRWDKTLDGKVKYLKLQCNPIGWLLALLSILASISAVAARRFYSVKFDEKNTYLLLESLTLIYISYMLVMLKMGRVMYLYHYFTPLTICFITGVLFLKLKLSKEILSRKFAISICCLAIGQIICFFYFSPFTYHLPLSAQEFEARNWLEIWRNELIFW